MHRRLKEIIETKKQEVEMLKREGILPIELDIPPVRDFKGALSSKDKISLIAEIKFASPSAGIIREQADPFAIGRTYEAAGASAISLLTDRKFFGGDLNNLPLLKKKVSIPILRKDFIIDEMQLRDASVYGADAALLIVRILSKSSLKDLISLCGELNLAPLVEIHNEDELETAIDCGADIIGINNRDLDTFEIDLATTTRIAPMVPEDCVLVGESGIKNPDDIQKLKGKGVNAVLVGTSLMSSDDPKGKVREFVEAGRGKDSRE